MEIFVSIIAMGFWMCGFTWVRNSGRKSGYKSGYCNGYRDGYLFCTDTDVNDDFVYLIGFEYGFDCGFPGFEGVLRKFKGTGISDFSDFPAFEGTSVPRCEQIKGLAIGCLIALRGGRPFSLEDLEVPFTASFTDGFEAGFEVGSRATPVNI